MIAVGAGSLPRASRGVVEAAVRELAERPDQPQVVLLNAAPVWDDEATLTISSNGKAHPVTVHPASTVLEVLDVLDTHGDGMLVIPTALTETELGPSLCAQVAFHKVKSIDPWEAIREAAKAQHVDQRLRSSDSRWIAQQLLTYGDELWKRRSQPPRILTRHDVLQRILGIQLHGNPDVVVDVATMLSWSQTPTNIAQWQHLSATMRQHLSHAIAEVAGRSAAIVTTLAETGEAHDALAVAIAAKALDAAGDKAMVPLARFEQRYFGNQHPAHEALRKFAEAGRAHLQRTSAEHPDAAAPTYSRAEAILVELGAGDVVAESEWFIPGFTHRLTDFATQVNKALRKPDNVDRAEQAWQNLSQHKLAEHHHDSVDTAHDALRLLRWLSTSELTDASVSDWVEWQIREGAWADVACARLRVADTNDRPQLRQAYRAILAHARARKTRADRRFAARLKEWGTGDTDRLLLAENLQERIMRPLANANGREGAPLLIICDGMSSADATTIGADIAASGGWVEVGRDSHGREGALATFPSSTVYSRASLLSGRLNTGGQDEERRGLAQLWGRRSTKLFHKGDLRAVRAEQIPDSLHNALAERHTVVAVVLNTIDDALDKDDLASRPVWNMSSIDYLAPLLEAASRASRPVVLCSDHGHIREYDSTKSATAGDSARWRTGTDPGDGEIAVCGPRVLESEPVVAAVDENIRYRSKKAGYHGGASLAEMVIPVHIYVPTPKARAEHWVVYDPETSHAPVWWKHSYPPATPQPPLVDDADSITLFDVDELSLGQRVCESEIYKAQASGVRRAPDPAQVAEIINAAQTAGGVLASAHIAQIANKGPASIRGYVANLQRVLNLDGAQVLSKIDNGTSVRFSLGLMRQQFLGGRQ